MFCPEVEFYVGEDVQWSIPQAFDLEDGQIEMEWVATNEYNIDSNFDLSCGDNQCLYDITYSVTDTSANTVSCDVKVLISSKTTSIKLGIDNFTNHWWTIIINVTQKSNMYLKIKRQN